MIFNSNLKQPVLTFILFIGIHTITYTQCSGIDADAGPDLFVCDPTQLIQLQGSVQGNYSKFYWTPVAGLSDPNVLDPIVTTKIPGKYTFKLTAEGLSNVNLIVNGDFESGNTGFNTGYTYNFINTTEGEYIVTSTPSTWNGGFSPCGDHTTGSSNMLLLNGHPTAGTNCWCQTVTTVVGRMYQFEFWSQSVVAANIAQLNVKLNGTPIGATQAGGLCNWERFVVNFVAATTSTTLCINETTGIRSGNDFALDDIALYEKCVDTDDVMVEIVNLVAKIDIPFKPKCSSDIFDLTAIGSTAGANISYEWSTDVGKIISQNGLSAKGRGSGNYTIKVIYTNGNVTCETEASIEYIAPDVLTGTLSGSGKVNCRNDSIILNTNMSSGSGLYSYKWSPDTSILKGQNTDSVFVNKAKKYTVTVTDQSSGCTLIMDYDVSTDTLKPLAQIKGDTLIDCRNSNVLLKSTINDSIKYFIKWIAPDSSVISNRTSILNSQQGKYKLIVEDNANHCHDSATWNVTIDTIPPGVDLGSNLNIDCNNDSVSVTNLFPNSSGTFSYFWTIDNTKLTKETSLQNKNIIKASRVLLRLLNETNGCETSDSLIVSDSRQIPILDAGNAGLLTCKNKQIQLNAIVNPNDSLLISWTSASGNIVSGKNSLQPIINLKGWYSIHITNQITGCENQDSVFVDENNISPNAILGPDLTFSCIDSVKTIDGSNSSSGNNIQYLWSSINGTIKSGNGTNRVDVSSSGAYKLIVVDTINGCSDTAYINVNPDLNKPILAIIAPDTLSCKNMEITLSASANSQAGDPLDFIWTNSAGAPIQSPKSLQTIITVPGIYTFTATDKINGCSSIIQTSVNIDTLKPAIDAGPDQIWNCATTQINLNGNVINNLSTYTYEWSTNNGSINGNPDNKKILISAPGSYTFFVIDEINGCGSLDSLVVIPDLVKPVIVFQLPDTLNCIHSTIAISAQGSSTGNRILYDWKTNNGQIISPVNQINIVVDKPGNYQLILTDTINKCIEQQSILIIEDKQPPIVDAGVSTALNCQTLDLILSGNLSNSASSKLNWKTNQGSILSKSDSIQIKIDKPGIYYLEVTNSGNGCVGIDSVLVTKTYNLIVDAGVSTELTCRVNDAILSGNLQNGAGNETISWSTNQGHFIGNVNSKQVMVDRTGWYYFIVTNAITGCNGIDSVIITENTNIPTVLNFEVEQPKCPGDSWQADITNIVGGEKPIQVYLDNQLINGLSMQGNSAGNYIIKVVDKNGCELSNNFTIINPPGVTVQLVPLVKLSAGVDYNLLPVYSIPDDSIASVLWTPADFLSCTDCPYPIIKGINKDLDYTVTYTNRNGCSATARVRIELLKKDIWFPNVISPNGDNINDSFYPVVTEDSYNEIRSMQIYDRWGNQLFSREHFPPNDPGFGWKGDSNNERVNPGAFIYIVVIEWKNGETESGLEI